VITEIIITILSIAGEFANPKGIGPIKPPKANLIFPSDPDDRENKIRIIPTIRKRNPTKNKSFIKNLENKYLKFFYQYGKRNMGNTRNKKS